MKKSATRVVQATLRPYERYRVEPPRQYKRRHRGMRRLIALVAIVAVVYWLVNGSRVTTKELLRRVVGAGTEARIAAIYHGASDAVHYVLAGGSSDTTSTSASTTPANTGNGTGAAVTVSGLGAATTPTGGSAAHAGRTGLPAATTPGSVSRRAVAVIHSLPPILAQLPASSLLQNDYQVFETWNNCGPASLSMALSYFGIHESQAVLGQALRPYENDTGDNDDKDVTMDALANEARSFGLLAYHRPNGNIQLLKRFIASGMPVIAETLLQTDDDIGHFRVVKGYDDRTQTFIQDDSMQGHNVHYSYADFDYLWKRYNYEYLVLVPPEKEQLAQAILGKDLDTRTAWRETVFMDRAMLAKDPADVASRFNLSVALYYVGEYRQSVNEFEQVRSQLSPRTLWYQIEPIEAYYALGEYQQVFSLTDAILNNGNRAFSQLYILRGRIDQKQGNLQAAKTEFENAVFYNKNLKEAQDALRSVSQ